MKDSKKICILFTSIGRRVELVQEFKKAASDLGVKLEIIGADISTSAPALTFCDRAVIVPRISDAAYIPTLLQICEEYHIDALIPTIDTDLLILSKTRNRFAALGTTVFIAAPEKIALCRDKRLTASYFHSLGLRSPLPVDDINMYSGGFPAFIKPLDGSSSIGANKANSFNQLAHYASQLSGYIVQPFISGTEYTVDIFCDMQGAPVFITPRIRQAVRSGEVLKTQIHHEDTIVSEMLNLIDDFKPCGPITVQLIRDDSTGINHYIEINPRFGGGAPLSMKAGANAAQAALRMLCGKNLTYAPKAATDGSVYSRFDQSICVDSMSPAPIKAVIFDLDDTLYSEKQYVRSGYKQVAKLLHGVDHAEEKLWSAFESGKPAIDYVLEQEGIFSPELKSSCLSAYRTQIPDISLYEGIPELLFSLRASGIKIGIITDGRPEGQRAKLKALGLYDLVDSILITDELGGPQFRKPNDIAFRIMQGRFNVPYESMVYVGDNVGKDFYAPKVLGMQWIHFDNEDGVYRSPPSIASVSSITDLQDKLLSY